MGFWSSSGREADGGHGSKNNHDLKSNLPARCCRCDRQPCICQGSGTTSIPRKPVNTVTSSHSEHHSYRSTEQKGRTSSGRDLTSTRQQQRSVEDLATSLVPRSKAHHSSSRHDQAAQGVRIRQQRRKGSDRREAQPSSQTSDSPEPYVQPLPNLWQSFLPYMPQSIDDQSIVMSFKRIIGPAGQYVNNFYEDRPGLLGDIQPFLEPLGFSCREAYSDLTMSLETLQHPTTAIKHSLVVMLLSVIHPDNLSRLPSILPDEFLAMTKATRQSSTPDNEDIPEFYKAFCAYRALGFYLRQNILQDKAYLDRRDRSIDEIVADFEAVFQPWLRASSDPNQRCAALVGLLQNTAQLGITLYSQPSTFFFRWDIRQVSSRDITIAISPSLVKMYDEEALEIDEGGQCLFESQVEPTRLRPSQRVAPKKITNFDTEPRSINPLPLPPKLPIAVPTQGQQSYIAELSGNPVLKFTTKGPDLDVPDTEFLNGTGINLNAQGSMRYDSSLTTATDHSDDIQPGNRGRTRRDVLPAEVAGVQLGPSSFPKSSFNTASITIAGRSTSRRASMELSRDRDARHRERSRSMSSAQDQTKAPSDWDPNSAAGRGNEEQILNAINFGDDVWRSSNRGVQMANGMQHGMQHGLQNINQQQYAAFQRKQPMLAQQMAMQGVEARECDVHAPTYGSQNINTHTSTSESHTMNAPYPSTYSPQAQASDNNSWPETSMEARFRNGAKFSSSRNSQNRNGESKQRPGLRSKIASHFNGRREQNTLAM